MPSAQCCFPSTTTSPANVESFLAALGRSEVLPARQFEQLRARVDDGRYPGELRPLARKLVKRRILTEYQIRHILHSDRPGLVLGRYLILDRLGRGSMGRVYKARHRLMGREVALKVIDPATSTRRGAWGRFRSEMQLVARLDHPNIVRAYDADQVGGVPFIVMEYLSGRDLEQILRADGPISPADALDYATQAALGLAHAHGRGVVHRDIKPSNLMVDDAGHLKIMDFGIASMQGRRPRDPAGRRSGEDLAVGTVAYMSPEQARGERMDGRGDLYSLGCVLYHLLSGRVPFPASNRVASLTMRVYGQRPAPISDFRGDLQPGLADLIARLMAPNPEDRFSSASEAAEEMLALRAGPARVPSEN